MVVRGMCEWRAVRFHLLRFSPTKTTFQALNLKENQKNTKAGIKSGNHHTLDPSIDDGKWFSAKVLKENAKLQANCSLSSLPLKKC